VILGAAALVLLALAKLPTIVQDPLYHAFADGRSFYGVANFWNVISNVPFLIAAFLGLRALRSPRPFTEAWERTAYRAFLVGAAAVGVGSSYYHLYPDDSRLFWDRLPMTIVFMSLVATTIGERVSMKAGRQLLLPMILLGIASVFYWRWSGDLRLYCLVQFGSLLALPFLLARFPPRYSGTSSLWCTVILYVVAKVVELLDHEIASFIATGGHPWKHAAAGIAVLVYVNAVAHRRLKVTAWDTM